MRNDSAAGDNVGFLDNFLLLLYKENGEGGGEGVDRSSSSSSIFFSCFFLFFFDIKGGDEVVVDDMDMVEAEDGKKAKDGGGVVEWVGDVAGDDAVDER